MYPNEKANSRDDESGVRLIKSKRAHMSKKIWATKASICVASLLLYFGLPYGAQLADKLEIRGIFESDTRYVVNAHIQVAHFG